MSKYDVFDVACLSCGDSTFGVLLKPETLNRIICPECKIAGYVYVSDNLDILTFKDDEICKKCNGSGKCQTCKGTGEMSCYQCNGIGYYTHQGNGAHYGCDVCGGEGGTMNFTKLRTELKFGSGRVTCKDCLETSVCQICNGFRFIKKEQIVEVNVIRDR